jgi:ankyrin repeat protein
MKKIFILLLVFISTSVYPDLNFNWETAIKNNNIPQVKKLIKKNDINGKEYLLNPLSLAAMYGRLEIFKILLDNGADLNKLSAGATPLHYAARYKSEGIVKYILSRGINANVRDDFQRTPLYYAIDSRMYDFKPGPGNPERDRIIRLLMESGADINAVDKNLETPLTYSIIQKEIMLASMFVDKGAIINIKNYQNETALSRLILTLISLEEPGLQQDSLKLMEKLIKKGAAININGYNASSPLQYATYLPNNKNITTELLELLFKSGADINFRGSEGSTALFTAAWAGNENAVQMLINKGADINFRNNYNETALHKAAEMQKINIAELLLKNGAQVNVKDRYGLTPLHIFIWRNGDNVEFVKLLVKYGADVNAQDNKGYTVLYSLASNCYYINIINELLKNGADPHIKAHDDPDPFSPYDLAVSGKKKGYHTRPGAKCAVCFYYKDKSKRVECFSSQ